MASSTTQRRQDPLGQLDTGEDSLAHRVLARIQAEGAEAPSGRIRFRIQLALLLLAVAYTLALARDFLVPIVLALLLSLILAPIVNWLAAHRIPRWLGSVLLVVLLVGGAGWAGSALGPQLSTWFDRAPALLQQLEQELYPIRQTVKKVNRTAEEVNRLASVGEGTRAGAGGGSSLRSLLYDNAAGLVTTTVMVVLLLYFFLAWGGVVVQRLAQLIPAGAARERYLDLAALLETQLARYLLIITLINLCLGAALAGVLFLLDMPNPLMWGAAATVLNFVPYLGGLAMTLVLGGAALLSFSGLTQPLLVTGSFLALTVLEGQVITPEILGRRMALNPLLVFVSVTFWFWIWGVLGAFLAVPILITLKLCSERVRAMRPVLAFVGR